MRDRGVLSSHVLFGREVVLCIWEKGSLQGELIQWIVKRRKLKPIGEQATNTLQVEYFTSFRPLTWKVISSRACCFLISTARPVMEVCVEEIF